MTATVAIYSHPELYPPTLSAIYLLSDRFEKIHLICNNVIESDWEYPPNVELIKIGEFEPIRSFEKKSILWKLNRFLSYTRILNRLASKSVLVLVYDPIPLLSYGLSFLYLKKESPFLWYHNHDVSNLDQLRKGSIGWIAAKMEPFFFRFLDLFTLPAEERKLFFPLNNLKGRYFLLPNFPSKKVYAKVRNSSPPQNNLIKLIYQGSISPGHGLEVVIAALGSHTSYTLMLTLIGNISKKYKDELEALAERAQTKLYLTIESPVGYKSLPLITCQHHIGLAIHEPKGMIYSTGGTASNKIYEYAACGLPILYLNTPHYTEYLQSYKWAKSIDLEVNSILHGIELIHHEYSLLSYAAKQDFLQLNNYELASAHVIQYAIDQKIRIKNS